MKDKIWIDRTPTPVSHLAKWMTAFLRAEEAEQFSLNTLQFYRVEFRRFIRFCTAEDLSHVEELTPNVMRGYFLHLAETGRNSGGVDAAWRALKTFTRWYEYEEEPDSWRNPFLKLKRGRVNDNPVPPIGPNTVRRLIEACKGSHFTALRDRALILFLLDTGMRAFEVCSLDIDDVDAIGGVAVIQQGKGGKRRAAAFGHRTARSLRIYLRARGDNPGPFWTTDDGRRLTYSGLRQILRRRSKVAGIREPGIHSFRRACSLALTRANVPTLLNQMAMGHSDPKTTMRYNDLQPDDLVRVYSHASPVDNVDW